MKTGSVTPPEMQTASEEEFRRRFGVRMQERRLSLKNSPRTENKKTATQKGVAKELGVNIDTVKSWEAGEFLPSLYHFNKLCEILDCDADYLLGNIDRPYREAFNLETDTGLSAKACAHIHNLPHILTDYLGNEFPYSYTDALDSLLSSDLFMHFLNEYVMYVVSSIRACASVLRAEKRVPKRRRYEKLQIIPTGEHFDIDLALIDCEAAVKCHEFEALDLMRKIIEAESAFASEELKEKMECLLDGREIDKALRIHPPEDHVYYTPMEITADSLVHELTLLCRSVLSPAGNKQKLSHERAELLSIQFNSIVSRLRTLAECNPDGAEEAIRNAVKLLEKDNRDIVPNALDRICTPVGETYKEFISRTRAGQMDGDGSAESLLPSEAKKDIRTHSR